MTIRVAKLLLLTGIGFFYTLVVFNNLTDFDSNYEFVRHVLMMDTTFAGNHGMWRSLPWRAAHLAFYFGIIGWEIVNTLLLWWGVMRLLRAVRKPVAQFQRAKRIAIWALTCSLLMWLVAFLSVGGEWFLMWQSHLWNGQDEAFRMFTVVGIVFIVMVLPDTEAQL